MSQRFGYEKPANKIDRKYQDKLNSLTTSQLVEYGQSLSGQLAIIIFDKDYKVVKAKFDSVITFTSKDYETNKIIFEKRNRKIGDKSIFFTVESDEGTGSWEKVDLAFVKDFVQYDGSEYVKIDAIFPNGQFTGYFTESGKNEVLSNKESWLLSDNIVASASLDKFIRDNEDFKQESFRVEYIKDNKIESVDRNNFCVVGDRVETTKGIGKITEFNGYEEKSIIKLEKSDKTLFSCYKEDVIRLVTEQEEPIEDKARAEFLNFFKNNIEINNDLLAILYETLPENFYDAYSELLSLAVLENEEYFYTNRYGNNVLELAKLDQKLLKYIVLYIKNNPKYFEEGGHEKWFYDKMIDRLNVIEKENKILKSADDGNFIIYFLTDKIFVFNMTNISYKYFIQDDRIKSINKVKNEGRAFVDVYNFFKNAETDTPDIISEKMRNFVDLIEQ